LRLDFTLTDSDTTHLAELRNGVLSHHTTAGAPAGVTTLTLSRPTLIALVTGASTCRRRLRTAASR
jgi:alkyl sulfatase BDS1-like metallo-beta-lactamase superfamily hydrolase